MGKRTAGLSILILVFGGLLPSALAAEHRPRLPTTVPAPPARPGGETQDLPAPAPPVPSPPPAETSSPASQPLPKGAATPLPEPRPNIPDALPGTDGGSNGPATAAPPTRPAPTPRPTPPEEAGSVTPPGPAGSLGHHNAKNLTPRIDAKLAEADAACRLRLKELGVVFEPQPPLSDPQGCSAPLPLSVSELGKGISLEPAGIMNCPMAEAVARFAQSTISTASKSVYGAELKTIANASAFVCRPRNGTTKLSEHAFANALDMARFVLSDGTAIDVAATTDARAARFLAEIRMAACGPFKTVLGPGSDADHANHFHLDLQARRNGSTYCR